MVDAQIEGTRTWDKVNVTMYVMQICVRTGNNSSLEIGHACECQRGV